MRKLCTKQRDRAGFTLIELLTTLAVGAIALAVAIPSFNNLIASNRLTTATNNLVAAINQARLQAIKVNDSAQFCASTGNSADTLGTACTTAGPGAVVVTQGATTAVAQAALALPGNVQLSSMQALRFGGTGLGRIVSSNNTSGLVVDISTNRISSNNHRCIYLVTGSVVSSCSSSASCTANEPENC